MKDTLEKIDWELKLTRSYEGEDIRIHGWKWKEKNRIKGDIVSI